MTHKLNLKLKYFCLKLQNKISFPKCLFPKYNMWLIFILSLVILVLTYDDVGGGWCRVVRGDDVEWWGGRWCEIIYEMAGWTSDMDMLWQNGNRACFKFPIHLPQIGWIPLTAQGGTCGGKNFQPMVMSGEIPTVDLPIVVSFLTPYRGTPLHMCHTCYGVGFLLWRSLDVMNDITFGKYVFFNYGSCTERVGLANIQY